MAMRRKSFISQEVKAGKSRQNPVPGDDGGGGEGLFVVGNSSKCGHR